MFVPPFSLHDALPFSLVDGVILLAHIAWHDVTAVGGYIKTDIVEPRGRSPLKQRAESPGIATDIIKAQIVNEEDEWPRCLPQQREEIGQCLEPIRRELDQSNVLSLRL